MTADAHPNGIMVAAEVADLFHVNRRTVGRWADEGKLPYFRTLGGHRRYLVADVEKRLAEMRTEARNGG